MSKYPDDSDYIKNLKGKTGILLTNLGSPAAATTSEVRRYLAEFLSDPRIVESPRWIWKLVLHGIILRTRPRKAAHAYQQVWTEQGSPLVVICQSIADKLQQQLAQQYDNKFEVVLAMRYGQPSITSGIDKLKQAGVERILVFPLYPQYSATTTGSTFDAVFDYMKTSRAMPELRMINQYYDHPAYIRALADSIRDGRSDNRKLMMSFHGLPQDYVDKGDPYQQQCLHTAELLASELGLNKDDWLCCFQSRFGPKQWLQPYTDKTLEQLAKDGLKAIDLVCPGFSADCLETLEEIDMQNRELFLENGGEQFQYIPALNDSDLHIDLLSQIIAEYCKDWIDS